MSRPRCARNSSDRPAAVLEFANGQRSAFGVRATPDIGPRSNRRFSSLTGIIQIGEGGYEKFANVPQAERRQTPLFRTDCAGFKR
jgi:hypothetical protein